MVNRDARQIADKLARSPCPSNQRVFSFGFFFGTLPGFIFFLCMASIAALLYFVYRLYRPRPSKKMERLY
jgi:hypothetical protein